MYIKIPINQDVFTTKKEVIRWIKAHKNKRVRISHNNKKTVQYWLNNHNGNGIQKVKTGVYVPFDITNGELLNIGNDFTRPREEYFNFKSGNSYGVCDNVKNFLEVFDEELTEIPEKVCVTLTPMYKSQQSAEGGWRWHKWGPYIGNQEITTEYLYDEKDIDVVWAYHIFVVI